MRLPSTRLNKTFILLSLAVLAGATLACTRSAQSGSRSLWSISKNSLATATLIPASTPTPAWGLPTRRAPGDPILTPTPDAQHALPSPRTAPDQYTVQAGDSLGQIANRYGVSVELVVQANKLANPNILEIGQVLTIPAPTPAAAGPDFKVLPDSELVNGPVNVLFDVQTFIQEQGGYLASYYEEVDDASLSGAQIVERVSREYSVNPRLLLAVLEHQSRWLTDPRPKKDSLQYPIGWQDPQRKGLYRQLAWAANNLNRGYYMWRVGGVGTWLLSDGSIVPIAPTINAGTAAVQQMYALLYGRQSWEQAVSEHGLFATFNALFGYPFDYAIEPLLPPDLAQPTLQLPFEPGKLWAFTGGPHGGWGDGSAWAALDFAPPGEALGCVPSSDWVVALADGLIVRAENGAVVQDLDGDGFEQTSWTILYMHVDSQDRVKSGAFVKAGERIGHPSCEGGVSSGTHLHVARRYNGEWIPADQSIPFVLDGWISLGAGKEYDGYLQLGSKKIEAYAGNSDENGIQR